MDIVPGEHAAIFLAVFAPRTGLHGRPSISSQGTTQ